MSTWTSKAVLAGAALLCVGACEDGQGTGLFDGLSTGASFGRNLALSQSPMAGGGFMLVPPQGFCIDKRSLRQRFALLARCDTLGAPSLAAGAPLGLITVSATPAQASDPLPDAEFTATAAKLDGINSIQKKPDRLTFRAEGAPPIAGLDTTHWRGTARIGDHFIGIAVYGAKDSRAISSEGREVIDSLIRLSRAAS